MSKLLWASWFQAILRQDVYIQAVGFNIVYQVLAIIQCCLQVKAGNCLRYS